MEHVPQEQNIPSTCFAPLLANPCTETCPGTPCPIFIPNEGDWSWEELIPKGTSFLIRVGQTSPTVSISGKHSIAHRRQLLWKEQ